MFRARVSPLLWHAPGKTVPPCSTRQGTPPVAVPCYHGASFGLSIREFSTWSLRSSIRNRLDLVAFSRIYVSRGFSTASGPFRPFGGAVDIVVVEQQDGSFRCSPWYVKFGKFQGVLRKQERIVAVSVNDVDAGFNMYLNRKGDVYFLKDTMNEHLDDERLNARDVKSSDSEEILLDVKNEPDTEVFKVDLTAENRMAGGFVRWYRRRRFMKRRLQTLIPTSEQLASLNLKDGKNKITFTFFTHVLGKRQLDAGIYLMKWNAKIVISDVDGTITKSDVLGQFMPLLGRDWSQTGVTRLFSAIKDNGYKLIFLSSRAISQANRTRKFLMSLKQDGEQLPDGPVVMSPDGIFPSLYREVVQRTPHEFKIECLQEIRSLFPSNYNPFYAGFGNRDTDVISYLKVGIPMGKIFTINPKGELIVNNAVDVKCYASLHKLLDEMFPPVEECGAWGSCGLRDKDSTGNARILDVLAAEIRSMLEEDMGVPVLIISCDIPRAESSHFIE